MGRLIGERVKVNSVFDLMRENKDIVEIDLSEMHAFRNHPFQVSDDERMAELENSIREYGVLVPGIVRPRQSGGYEIISGHRRKHACEKLGLQTMPVLIRRMKDEEAVLSMIDSNLYRDHILPSEKARSYRMKYEVLKHQGKKNGEVPTYEELGKMFGESGRSVHRYLRLAELTESLLHEVDEGRLPITQAVHLSYLTAKEQEWVFEYLQTSGRKLTSGQILKLRENSCRSMPKGRFIRALSVPERRSRTVRLGEEDLRPYYPPYMSEDEIKEDILGILKEKSGRGLHDMVAQNLMTR